MGRTIKPIPKGCHCLKRNGSFIEFRTWKWLPTYATQRLTLPKVFVLLSPVKYTQKKSQVYTLFHTTVKHPSLHPKTTEIISWKKKKKTLLATFARKPSRRPGISQQTLLYSKVVWSGSLSLILVKTTTYQVLNELITFYYGSFRKYMCYYLNNKIDFRVIIWKNWWFVLHVQPSLWMLIVAFKQEP